MNKQANTGMRRVVRATRFSWQGVQAAWTHEAAFRQEIVATGVLLPGAFVIGQNGVQVAILVGVLGIVLITELLNSAIEAVVDRIGEEQHHLSGRAKDMGSAAVFVSLLVAVVVWVVIGVDNYLID